MLQFFQQQLASADQDANPVLVHINASLLVEAVRREEFDSGQNNHNRLNAQDMMVKAIKPSYGNAFQKQDQENFQLENQIGNQQFTQVQLPKEKFKVLGISQGGEQIYRISDFYLAHNQVVESIYKRKINSIMESQRKRKRQDMSLNQSLQSTVTKFLESFSQNNFGQISRQRRKISLQQLQQIISQLGQSKTNFFLYYKHNVNRPQNIGVKYNPHLSNPFFLKRLKGQAIKGQPFVKQVQSEQNKTFMFQQAFLDEEENVIDDLGIMVKKQNRIFNNHNFMEEQEKEVFWGSLKQKKQEEIKFIIEEEQQKVIQTKCLKDQIISKFNYYNPQLISGWKKSITQLKRLQIDLNNPAYQLEKILNFTRKTRQQFQIPPPQKQKHKDNRRGVRKKIDLQKRKEHSQAALQVSSRPTNQANLPNLQITPQQSLQDMMMQHKSSQKTGSQVVHSQVARRLSFVKFVIDALQFKDYHRYCWSGSEIWSQINFLKGHVKKPKNFGLKINQEVIQSYDKFRVQSSLSAKQGTLCLIQQIQQNPLMLSNPGMCSKIIMHVDMKRMTDKLASKALSKPPIQQIQGKKGSQLLYGEQGAALFRQQLHQKLGPLGSVVLQQNGNCGLLGHFDDVGITVLQNNMYAQSVVRQTTENKDYLLFKGADGKWSIRKIDHIYTAGQIQPRMDFFSPDSRWVSSFLINYLKSYIKLTFERQKIIHFERLRQIFRSINQHNVRKTLKAMQAQTTDNKIFTSPHQLQKDLDVSPQQVCLYQKMQNTLYQLRTMGIQLLRVPDKIKLITTLYFKKNPQNLQGYVISKIICQELHLCPWYLTQSYKSSQQGQGKLQLRGYGDPTSGHGGISFIKRPQKKRLDKDQQPQQDKNKSVTGTNADLRKLRNQNASKLLLDHGISPQEVQDMNRWEKVSYLKQIASKSKNMDLSKFRRELRATKKMKKQAYQKDIDKLFNQLIKNISANQVPQEQVGGLIGQALSMNLDQYMRDQVKNWQIKKEKMLSRVGKDLDEQDYDDDDGMDYE